MSTDKRTVCCPEVVRGFRSRRAAACRTAPLLIAGIVILAAPAISMGQPQGPMGQRPAAVTPANASTDGIWAEVAAVKPPAAAQPYVRILPQAYRAFEMKEGALKRLLGTAPLEFTPAAAAGNLVLAVPMPDGTFARFRIAESPILSAKLAATHPELKTYTGQGIDDPAATMRCDTTPLGFHAMVLSTQGAVYVDPLWPGDVSHYVSYYERDLSPRGREFTCLVTGSAPQILRGGLVAAPPSGANLRTYRLAMTATGEYTVYFGGTAAAQAQITTTVNRVTGIYEREVAIRLNIVAFNIYTDPATDPFDTSSVDGALLDANNNDLNANVGSANYDIGHLVSASGGGGLAGLGVVCGGSKGRGATALPNPQGDGFDVDYVAHEMGHQFGGDHTFNSTADNCGGGNREASSAYEPGSGTTIMAYAGICDPENVQLHSDPYFHTRSFDQITDFREAGGNCGVQTATGNTAPTVNAGADYTIPRDTPFTLTAAGSDADGDALTYCWEEFDLGASTPPPNMADGPLFRSRPPTVSPSRTFPRLSTILSGSSDPWERLPTVDRAMSFRCTVRDNRAGGGGVNYDSMVVTVSGDPFRVTAPNGGETLAAGEPTTVTWDVGGGSVASNVNILISYDGGNNFTTLLPNTPNDGSESVTLPCTTGATMRIKVEAVGNIFFDISDGDCSVDNAPPTITSSATGGDVDDNCTATVTFSATVSDDTCVLAADVKVNVSLTTGNATLGTPTINVVQTDEATVDVTGSVTVSDLTSCPATVTVTVDAVDCCGLPAVQSVATADVSDTTDPTLTCPADVTVTCGAPTDPSATGTGTAVDNCDPAPVVNYSDVVTPTTCLADPVMYRITRTWTAIDVCSNTTSCDQTITVLKVVGSLDIKPGSCPNPLGLKNQGSVPVGLLGTADFDVSEVDPASIRISREDCVGGSVAPLEGPLGPHTVTSDVGTPYAGELCGCHRARGDGIPDLMLHFDAQNLIAALDLATLGDGTEVRLVVSGTLSNGCDFIATDCMIIRGGGMLSTQAGTAPTQP
jgi:hypothetical protein